MKYNYVVKVNGEYYAAGQEVPETKKVREEAKKLPFSDSDIEFETEPVRRGRPRKNG